MTGPLLIRGDGVAARCCAHLLTKAGFNIAVERTDRPRVPAIMLSDSALALIRDVFDQPALFAEHPRIERRIVCWGEGARPVSLDHSAIVLSEDVLLKTLPFGAEQSTQPAFIIHTAQPLPPGVQEHRFGTRRAAAAQVELKDPDDLSTCRIESLSDGWLFLIENWLLAIGAPLKSLLEQSQLIAPRVNLLSDRSGEFPSCPRIISPLSGERWLACGTVALGFDPICGDGTAQAIREAILAAAVVRAMAEGGDAPSLQQHYESRLTAGMARHIALCAEFYRTGGSGPWWQKELQALAEGYRCCSARLALTGQPRYQLRGFKLIPT